MYEPKGFVCARCTPDTFGGADRYLDVLQSGSLQNPGIAWSRRARRIDHHDSRSVATVVEQPGSASPIEDGTQPAMMRDL